MKYSEDRLEELLIYEGIIQSEDGISWDNSGSGADFTKFPCYGCLRKYKWWWMSRLCRWIHFTISPNGIPAQMVR